MPTETLHWTSLVNDFTTRDNVILWKAQSWCPTEDWNPPGYYVDEYWVTIIPAGDGTFSAVVTEMDRRAFALAARGPFDSFDAARDWGIATVEHHYNPRRRRRSTRSGRRRPTAWDCVLDGEETP